MRSKVTALLAALLLAASAVTASADPGQQLLDRTTAWAAGVLHVPAQPRTLVVLDEDQLAAGWGSAQIRCDQTGVIGVSSWHADEWRHIATGPAEAVEEGTASLVLHEALHLRLGGRSCDDLVTDADAWHEEVVTEAMTLDLLPAWGRKFTRWPIIERPEGPYAAGVWGVRQASTIAAGARNWRTRDARLWRRALYLASPADRVAMLSAAEALREADHVATD